MKIQNKKLFVLGIVAICCIAGSIVFVYIASEGTLLDNLKSIWQNTINP